MSQETLARVISPQTQSKAMLETKQAGLLRAFFRNDVFVADRIEFDITVLRDFYLSRGYIDFRTNSVNAELTRERDAYFLVFNVQEGQQFKLGEITVEEMVDNVCPQVTELVKETPV